jgi:hypothetical protein
MIRGVGPWGHNAAVLARRPILDGGERQHAWTIVSAGTGLAIPIRLATWACLSGTGLTQI